MAGCDFVNNFCPINNTGFYLGGITSGASTPWVKELFNISEYFGLSPVDFFEPLGTEDAPYSAICERLRSLDDDDLEKVNTFLSWITEQKDKV